MNSEPPSSSTSAPEVTNVSRHGLWVLLDDRELFLPFRQFPWFAEATISTLSNVERPAPQHLCWPALDIDLHVDSIENPEAFPLVSRAQANRAAP